MGGTDTPKVTGLGMEQMAVVHATRYAPKIDADGTLSIPTTFDANGGMAQDFATLKPRNTVHTSINGAVTGHEFGNWDDASHIVVAPLSHAIEKNGPPTGFATVDTYWARGENEALKLDQYIIIEKADVPKPVQLEDGRILAANPFEAVGIALKAFDCPQRHIGRTNWPGSSIEDEFDFAQSIGAQTSGLHMGTATERMETLLGNGRPASAIRAELDGKLDAKSQTLLARIADSPAYAEKNLMEDAVRMINRIASETRFDDVSAPEPTGNHAGDTVAYYTHLEPKVVLSASFRGETALPSPAQIRSYLERKHGQDLSSFVKPLHPALGGHMPAPPAAPQERSIIDYGATSPQHSGIKWLEMLNQSSMEGRMSSIDAQSLTHDDRAALANPDARHYALVGPHGTFTIASKLPGQELRLLDAAQNDAGFKPYADGLRSQTGTPPAPASRPVSPAHKTARP